MYKKTLISVMVILGLILVPMSAMAAGKVMVLDAYDKTGKVSPEDIGKLNKGFKSAYKKLRNTGCIKGKEADAALTYIKTKFADDKGCLKPTCQVKLMSEVKADAVASFKILNGKKALYDVKVLLLQKSKGILQDKAKSGWIEGEDPGLVGKRLAFRVVFLSSKDKSEKKKNLMLKAIGLSKDQLLADTKLPKKPTKKKEKVDPMNMPK